MNFVKKPKNRSLAWAGTIMFHVVLIILFFFTSLGMSYTIPPPPRQGININLGMVESGKKEDLNVVTHSSEVKKNTEENDSSQQNILMQEDDNTILINPDENKSKKDSKELDDQENPEEEEEEEEEEEKENETKLNPAAEYSPKGGQGKEDVTGKEGNIEGEITENGSEKGNFGDGLSKVSSNRSVPKDTLNYSLGKGKGHITILVIVDKDGNIIEIDNESFETVLGYLTEERKKDLYIQIKKDIRYGAAIGKDQSNKIAELKVNFRN